MSSTGNRRGLALNNTPRLSDPNVNTNARGMDRSSQLPRSLQSSHPDRGWTLPYAAVEPSEPYSPTYHVSRQSIQLPSVHTLLGSLSPQASHDRPRFNNGGELVPKIEANSLKFVIPSPVSAANVELMETRINSTENSTGIGFHEPKWHDEDAMDVSSVKAESGLTAKQHPSIQRKTSSRNESEFIHGLVYCH